MEEILTRLGYSQVVVDNFRREGVTPEAATLMNSGQFQQLGVEGVGRQAILISRCRPYMLNSTSAGTSTSTEPTNRSAVSNLFRPYNWQKKKKRKLMVTLECVCLALPSSKRIPSGFQKKVLTGAGLGKKMLSLESSLSASELREQLFNEYPKLKEAGGFQYLRTPGQQKEFHVIPLPPGGGYSVANLKAIVKQAKLYLRPIQSELDLSGEIEEGSIEDDVLVKCFKCGESKPETRLKLHRRSCMGSRDERPVACLPSPSTHQSSTPTTAPTLQRLSTSGTVDSSSSNPSQPELISSDEELPMVTTHGGSHSIVEATGSLPRTSDEGSHVACSAGPSMSTPSTSMPGTAASTRQNQRIIPYVSYVQECIADGGLSSDEEDSHMSIAIMESLQTSRSDVVTLPDILQSLSQAIVGEGSSKFNVNRAKVWDCAVRGFRRTSFHPANRLSVHFTDSSGTMEGAIDEGGPRNEFLTLLAKALQGSIVFEGPSEKRVLSMNASALNQGLYKIAGTMIAVIIVHGRITLRFLAKTTFNMMAHGFSAQALPEDIPDHEIKAQVEDILGATSIDELSHAAERASLLMSIAGCFRALTKLEDKTSLANDLTKFYLVDRTRSAYESFFEGMESLGVLGSIRQHHGVWEDCFCGAQDELSANILGNIFKSELSPEGGNRRSAESSTIAFWLDLLLDVQENSSSLSYEDILMFATGLHQVPITGFDPQPRLEFLHEPEIGETERSQFPKAHTCSCILKLPIHTTYETFKEKMEFGILSAPGFGFA